jgi:hypothetical protein
MECIPHPAPAQGSRKLSALLIDSASKACAKTRPIRCRDCPEMKGGGLFFWELREPPLLPIGMLSLVRNQAALDGEYSGVCEASKGDGARRYCLKSRLAWALRQCISELLKTGVWAGAGDQCQTRTNVEALGGCCEAGPCALGLQNLSAGRFWTRTWGFAERRLPLFVARFSTLSAVIS